MSTEKPQAEAPISNSHSDSSVFVPPPRVAASIPLFTEMWNRMHNPATWGFRMFFLFALLAAFWKRDGFIGLLSITGVFLSPMLFSAPRHREEVPQTVRDILEGARRWLDRPTDDEKRSQFILGGLFSAILFQSAVKRNFFGMILSMIAVVYWKLDVFKREASK